MRLHELHEYTASLLAAGVDPNFPVCVTDRDREGRLDVCEIDDVRMVTGPFREDPSPKLLGFLVRTGKVVLLTSGAIDYDSLGHNHAVDCIPVDAPEKSWPNGRDPSAAATKEE